MLTLNRVLLGGLIVTCFFVAGTLFWAYHVKQDTKAREAAMNKQLKETRESPQLGEHVPLIAETPKVPSDDASISSTQRLQEMKKVVETQSIDGTIESEPDIFDEFPTLPAKEGPNEEVRVSPFGFGPYPEIPPGHPTFSLETWDRVETMYTTDPTEAKKYELSARVLIQLWKQGKRPEGAKIINGLVYPSYPRTIYVSWAEEALEDGTVERYPTRVSGDPSFQPYEMDFYENGIFPSGFTMLSLDTDGINPYQFLDLP